MRSLTSLFREGFATMRAESAMYSLRHLALLQQVVALVRDGLD